MINHVNHIVVGVIRNPEGQILISQRPIDKQFGGLWEFPGGKVELNEKPFITLYRELREELDINVFTAKPLITIPYQYEHDSLHLDVWQITQYFGEAKGNEGQKILWVSSDSLSNYEFPEASRKVFHLL